jgi:ubiquinone biosynthesis protein
MTVLIHRTKNFDRYYQIVSVLVRHGFGTVMENMQIYRYLPFSKKMFHKPPRDSHVTQAEHLRLALEELGPTFVKLGQILSTRPDLIPPEYIAELSKLQDSVPPLPWDIIYDSISEEYEGNLSAIFTEIDPIPLGSASLSQVHPARLIDGKEVVLKIQRPKIRQVIDADLDIMMDLASLAERSSWGQLYHPTEIVEQFAFTLRNEMDYRREGLNADRFRENFRTQSNLVIPLIYWEYSTPHILVMERISGIKIDDIAKLDELGIDRQRVAEISSQILVKEVLEDGFFHADPHPGNFFVMGDDINDPIIGAMDFGMVGHVSKQDRMNLIQGFSLISRGNISGFLDFLICIGSVDPHVDTESMLKELERMVEQYRGLTLKDIHARRFMDELMNIAFRYQVKLPSDQWLLLKTLVMIDGLARQLDPDFAVFEGFIPPIRQIWLQMRMPWNWMSSLFQDLEPLVFTLREFPSTFVRMMRCMQRGNLPFSIEFGASKDTLDRLDRISTRFTLSILTAAFILGLALLLPLATANQTALVMIIIGFITAMGLGVWVVVSIIRG